MKTRIYATPAVKGLKQTVHFEQTQWFTSQGECEWDELAECLEAEMILQRY